MPSTDTIIDISHIQSQVDFTKLAGAGIQLVIMKASEVVADSKFAPRAPLVRQVGMGLGAYHFSRTTKKLSVDAQVKVFLDTVKPGHGALCVLDFEAPPASYGEDPMTAADGVHWCEAVERVTGVPVLVYSTTAHLNSHGGSILATSTLLGKKRPLWLARYPEKGAQSFKGWPIGKIPTGWTGNDVLLWQYTAWGRVAGVDGDCDRSVGDVASVRAAYPGAWA